ncbi:MlaC/ttg2D family ABC transporter substrate-binding protein [Motiliproteus sp.]|uniref:MlaC/ttg2D family ABC transporter substrate-binding protein n=1 Tax=Motiliproteus sp. TaxID=1898955 RepID=UPI003BAD2F01
MISMTQRWTRFWRSSLLMVLAMLVGGLAQAQSSTPEQVIDSSYQSLQRLIDDKVLVAGMPDAELLALMEKELGPVVDFPRIARKVMGKHGRKASDEQKQNFVEIFKHSLVKTYSKGLENLDQLKEVEIGTAVYDKKKKRAKVPSVITLKDGQTFQVQYALYLNKANEWKVENIIAEGINIGLVFRNQFAHFMEQHKDVGKVIDNWAIATAEKEQTGDAKADEETDDEEKS